MEIIIVMCVWLVAMVMFMSTIYLFFVKWTKLQDRTKEKHN